MTEKIKERVSYIYKHNGSKLDFKDKTPREIYFECCDFLDSLSG